MSKEFFRGVAEMMMVGLFRALAYPSSYITFGLAFVTSATKPNASMYTSVYFLNYEVVKNFAVQPVTHKAGCFGRLNNGDVERVIK